MSTIKDFLLSKPAEKAHDWLQYFDEAKSMGYSGDRASFLKYCHTVYKRSAKKEAPILTPTTDLIMGETSRTQNPDGTIESVIRSANLITNVDEMAAFCNINPDDFLPPKIITNRWGNSTNPNWQFKVIWVPKYGKDELTPKDAAREFKELIKDISLPIRKFKPIKDESITVVIGLTDSHIGQLTWGEEIGRPDTGNWDLNIATSELLKVIDFYCSYYKERNVKKFILPIGSDLFNVNSELGTVNNTPQDEDVRKGKTFRCIMETMIIIIEALAEIAPIECVYIPGNHDKDVAYDLIVGLCAAFRKQDSRITIDASPQDHKYIKIGNTLIGVAHGKVKGKDLKPADLPQIMARDAKELWGETLYHEWLIGHYHKLKDIVSDDINGTIIRVMPSITQLSYWTYSSGLKSTRQMEVFEYDDIAGHIKTVVYRP